MIARRAFSLLEILLSLAILGVAIGYLSSGFTGSLRNIQESRQVLRANLAAESILSQIAAGIYPTESTGETPYDADPRFIFAVSVEPVAGVDGLLAVTVNVKRGDISPAETVTLSRWLTDPVWLQEQAANNPLLNGTLADQQTDPTTGDASSSSGSGSGGGGS